MLLLQLGYIQMESTEGMGYPGLNLLKSWATPDRIQTSAIFTLLFSLVYVQILSVEAMGRPGWNLLMSWATLDGIHTSASYMLRWVPPDGV
jgi:hypothetical protein